MFAGGKRAYIQPEWRVPDNIIRVVIRGKSIPDCKRMFRNCAATKAGNEMIMTAITDVIKTHQQLCGSVEHKVESETHDKNAQAVLSEVL